MGFGGPWEVGQPPAWWRLNRWVGSVSQRRPAPFKQALSPQAEKAHRPGVRQVYRRPVLPGVCIRQSPLLSSLTSPQESAP